VPTAPASIYLLKRGTLPSFFGFFYVYGGPWSSRFDNRIFAALLIRYLPVSTHSVARLEIVARRVVSLFTEGLRALTSIRSLPH
jgi:hypothetical protein